MNITNNYNLPAPLVAAIRNDGYGRGARRADISATRLIAPPQMVELERQHADEITEDVTDRLWSLFGQAVHTVLERAGAEFDSLTEERLYMDVDGWTVSGQLDEYTLDESATLTDWKVVSTWSIIFGDKPEWASQLNTLAALLRANGHAPRALQIVALLRDWVASRAMREPDYPQRQIAVVPIPLWSPEQAHNYITERVKLHKAARSGDMTPCTDEERWMRGEKWAVMKRGRKSAVKLFDAPTFANKAVEQLEERDRIAGKSASYYVEHRPGTYMRCERYCRAAPWCKQWAATPKTAAPQDDEAA